MSSLILFQDSARCRELASVVTGADFQGEWAGSFDPLLRVGILRGRLGKAGGEHVGEFSVRIVAPMVVVIEGKGPGFRLIDEIAASPGDTATDDQNTLLEIQVARSQISWSKQSASDCQSAELEKLSPTHGVPRIPSSLRCLHCHICRYHQRRAGRSSWNGKCR